MPASIEELIADPSIAALTLRQPLEPVSGRDVPIFPPTYPPSRDREGHRFDTPYTINETGSGVRICDLDSVQSQANRMEAAFTGPLADVVPRHAVRAGDRQVDLTELPHRAADATIRATDFAEHLRACFEAVESGDPVPLAKVAPTSLVYGVWDSRDTHVRLPRAVRSEIRAHDVSVLVRSSQYTGTFGQGVLGLNDRQWVKAVDAGFAPTPTIDTAGGILVDGEIIQAASILLSVLRRYRTADGSELLPAYLLGLALGGLLTTGSEYDLRSGCALVRSAPGEWQLVRASGERQAIEITADSVGQELRVTARQWAAAAGVALGGEPTVHHYDPAIAKSMVSAA